MSETFTKFARRAIEKASRGRLTLAEAQAEVAPMRDAKQYDWAGWTVRVGECNCSRRYAHPFCPVHSIPVGLTDA